MYTKENVKLKDKLKSVRKEGNYELGHWLKYTRIGWESCYSQPEYLVLDIERRDPSSGLSEVLPECSRSLYMTCRRYYRRKYCEICQNVSNI